MPFQFNNTASSGIAPVRVHNTTSETIPAYGCVAIGSSSSLTPGIITRPGSGVGEGRETVPVRKPDEAAISKNSMGLFLLVTDVPIPAGEKGYATASVPAWARVVSAANERGVLLKPKAASWDLEVGSGFWSAIDIKTIGSQKYAWVTQQGGSGGSGSPSNYIFVFELKTNFDVGTAASCDIYEMAGDNVGSFVETAPVNDPLSIFSTLLAGDRGICLKQGSLYYAIQAACPTEYL